jgi:hypothetical protein
MMKREYDYDRNRGIYQATVPDYKLEIIENEMPGVMPGIKFIQLSSYQRLEICICPKYHRQFQRTLAATGLLNLAQLGSLQSSANRHYSDQRISLFLCTGHIISRHL